MYAAHDGDRILVFVSSAPFVIRSLGWTWQRIQDAEAYQTIGTWFVVLAFCLLAIAFLTDVVGLIDGDLLILIAALVCVIGLALSIYGRCLAKQLRRHWDVSTEE